MTPHRIFSTTYSFLSATRYHISGGLVLIVMAVLAMAVANSSLGPAYQAFWQQPVSLQIGSFNLFSHEGHPMTLLQFINDALMAIFFFSVGLEIKREVLVGELSSPRKALLPIIAACGGMLLPVTIYYLFTRGTPEAGGMAIPMATDIAFSLGVLSLCGKRVPLSLKVFLTAFAVVDDIGGILVIALFYSSAFHLDYLLLSAVTVLFMCIGNFCGVPLVLSVAHAGVVVPFHAKRSALYHCGCHSRLHRSRHPGQPHKQVHKPHKAEHFKLSRREERQHHSQQGAN